MTRLNLSLLLIAFSFTQMGNSPMAPGHKDGRLTPCPESPNCVSSQNENEARYVEPFKVSGDSGNALDRLTKMLSRLKRAKIVEQTEDYLHVEFKVALFGFIDDVEFLLDAKQGVIHLRSASRSGYWDFGLNRRRIKSLRQKWRALSSASNFSN